MNNYIKAIINHNCMKDETEKTSHWYMNCSFCFSVMLRVEQQDGRAKMGK